MSSANFPDCTCLAAGLRAGKGASKPKRQAEKEDEVMELKSMPQPQTVEEAGVKRSLLEDLALKSCYLQGELTLRELAAVMHLSLGIIREIFEYLRKEQFVEVKGMAGGDYRVSTTTVGKERAIALLMQNQYTGAAPVSFRDYAAQVRNQSVRDFSVRPEEMVQVFESLVLSESILNQIGTAVVSGTSIFLYGGTGTGKTAIAELLPRIYHDRVWIPHAVEVDGQIIAVFDPIVHEKIEDTLHTAHDERWVTCKRPRVLVGGELTFEMLDLQFNPVAKYYSAPVQMKANNGVLIIDDFGRQRIRPDELLNRWILPLDRHIDFLTLAGGRKLEIPFDLFVVFATNLNPADLADEAFLRRIHNKIKVEPMDPVSFKEIFKRLCVQLGLDYDPVVVDYLMDVLAREFNQPLRACYARDVINQIRWGAQYEGREAKVTREAVLLACKYYFISPAA